MVLRASQANVPNQKEGFSGYSNANQLGGVLVPWLNPPNALSHKKTLIFKKWGGENAAFSHIHVLHPHRCLTLLQTFTWNSCFFLVVYKEFHQQKQQNSHVWLLGLFEQSLHNQFIQPGSVEYGTVHTGRRTNWKNDTRAVAVGTTSSIFRLDPTEWGRGICCSIVYWH